jgi:Zn-dependent protease
LTFNPLRYADPMLSIVYPLIFLLAGGIGLPGGCVYVDHSRLRSRAWECAVSLAGPLSNIALALVLSFPFQLGLVDLQTDHWFWAVYAFVIMLQVSAALLNLLPIPPLDGFGAIAPWLPPATQNMLYRQAQLGMWITFLALWFVPFVSETFWGAVHGIVAWMGVPTALGWEGYQLFKIW